MRRSALLAAATVLMLLSAPAWAHLPQGYRLKLSTSLDGYELRVIVAPSKPAVNESFEVIVGAVNSSTGEPFRGTVLINRMPARRFSLAFYEVNLSFEEAGVHTVPVELVSGGERLELQVSVEVVEQSTGSRLLVPAMLFLLTAAVIGGVWLLRRWRM